MVPDVLAAAVQDGDEAAMIEAIPIADPGYFARLHWRLRERLPVWVVYRPITREYPGAWVARMHVVLPELRPTRFVVTHDTLKELRTRLTGRRARLW